MLYKANYKVVAWYIWLIWGIITCTYLIAPWEQILNHWHNQELSKEDPDEDLAIFYFKIKLHLINLNLTLTSIAHWIYSLAYFHLAGMLDIVSTPSGDPDAPIKGKHRLKNKMICLNVCFGLLWVATKAWEPFIVNARSFSFNMIAIMTLVAVLAPAVLIIYSINKVDLTVSKQRSMPLKARNRLIEIHTYVFMVYIIGLAGNQILWVIHDYQVHSSSSTKHGATVDCRYNVAYSFFMALMDAANMASVILLTYLTINLKVEISSTAWNFFLTESTDKPQHSSSSVEELPLFSDSGKQED